MTTHNFQFPITGVTGPAFRNNLQDFALAVASSNYAVADPPTMVPGMVQVTTGGIMRVRNAGNTAWVTLFPDVTVPNGGLLSPAYFQNDLSFGGNNTFTGETTFTSDMFLGPYVEANGTVEFRGADAVYAPTPVLADNSGRVATTSYVRSYVANNAATPLFTKTDVVYVSATTNGRVIRAHNLGGEPLLSTVKVVLNQAIHGYPVGARFDYGNSIGVNGSTQGIAVRITDVDIQVSFANALPIVTENGSAVGTLSPSNYFLEIRLWR